MRKQSLKKKKSSSSMFLGIGMTFGEIGILCKEPWHTDVICGEGCSLFCVPQEKFMEIILNSENSTSLLPLVTETAMRKLEAIEKLKKKTRTSLFRQRRSITLLDTIPRTKTTT